MSENREKVVLVTGGTRGLGLAIADVLADEGYGVVACGRKETEALGALVDRERERGWVRYEHLDLEDHASLHGFASRVSEAQGGLYGLVNNAALAFDGVLATMHETQIAQLLNVNVTGTIILTKYAIRSMLVARAGRVVNVASIIGFTGYNGLSVYGASKAAMLGFTRSLARELGKAGITVNALAPGYMETEMSAGLGEEQLAAIRRRSALGKLAQVSDVAEGVRYLLSPAAGSVTGTTLTIDTGSTA